MASVMARPVETTGDERALPFNHQVAAGIRCLVEHYRDQPALEDIAAGAGMSPGHFQRVFKRWAGIGPKRFSSTRRRRTPGGRWRRMRACSTRRSMPVSGPSRLHDLFVSCEAMTRGEFKAHGERLVVRWGLHDVPLGRVLLGVTERGVCWLALVDQGDDPVIAKFEQVWRGARRVREDAATAATAERAFALTARDVAPMPLLLRGTNLQL